MMKRFKFSSEQVKRASSVLQMIDLRMSQKDWSKYVSVLVKLLRHHRYHDFYFAETMRITYSSRCAFIKVSNTIT